MTTKPLDHRCFELARQYLSEVEGSDDADRYDLARAIEATIQDFVGNLRDELGAGEVS